MTDSVPISLPAVVNIEDWPELRQRLGLRVVRGYWPPGAARPTLEVTMRDLAEAGTGDEELQRESRDLSVA